MVSLFVTVPARIPPGVDRRADLREPEARSRTPEIRPRGPRLGPEDLPALVAWLFGPLEILDPVALLAGQGPGGEPVARLALGQENLGAQQNQDQEDRRNAPHSMPLS